MIFPILLVLIAAQAVAQQAKAAPTNGSGVLWSQSVYTSSISSGANNSNCGSIYARSEEWKPLSSAPHDGTVVEVLNTYGVAPTYGVFAWTKSPLPEGWWQNQQDKHLGLGGEDCMFYRPYHPVKGRPYIDPTNGQENKIRYWCDAMRLAYDQKHDRCILKGNKP